MKFAIILVMCLIFHKSNQELFTAIVDLEKLLDTEKLMVSSLDSYLRAEDARLARLKLLKESYLNIQDAASHNIESYVGNPVNAYLLVKRLTKDWKDIESLIVSTPAELGRQVLASLNESKSNETFPSNEDLNGAAAALLRLQDTYKLDTSTLAKGFIPLRNSATGPMFNTKIELTAGDCFELGKHSYNNGDHYHTVLWMQEALDRVAHETIKTTEPSDILEYLAFSTYQQGNVRQALELTNDLLEILPNHERAIGNKVYYDDIIKKETLNRKRGDAGNVAKDASITESTYSRKEESERDIYESLCRGEKRLTPKTESALSCFYLNTTKIPLLRLTRIKVEEAFKKPYILHFYDIMSDNEISVIKHLASPRLRRATVQNSETGNLEIANYRISKSAWLKDSDHPVVKTISRRIQAISGLTTSTAEELQVVNYGIGGHYEAHYDFARKEEKNAFKNLGTGNRIATWLNYMSDVDAGGATVFPSLGITLWPKKGSAAFWFNLHRSGEGDMLTRHAACPVLVGSKWVSNKWFHERGHEFLRPCGLRINE